MSTLSIKQNFVTDIDTFTWGKDWRATRIMKEKRTDADYYYASITRFYGEKAQTHDYDLGETVAEMAWLGRNEKFVGKREWRTDPDDQTRRKRIWTEPVTEIIEEQDETGKLTTREVLVEGKTIYEYTLKVTPENTKLMQQLEGAVALNQQTLFLFVYGAVPPHMVEPETFWKMSVGDYLQSIKPIPNNKTK